MFVTHGEAEAAQAMSEKIHQELGWSARVPELEEWVEL
ncbi:MBL fold metallo-hydrolase RNA specificity domain-containing protein [Endozoicomonas montiporae]